MGSDYVLRYHINMKENFGKIKKKLNLENLDCIGGEICNLDYEFAITHFFKESLEDYSENGTGEPFEEVYFDLEDLEKFKEECLKAYNSPKNKSGLNNKEKDLLKVFEYAKFLLERKDLDCYVYLELR